MPRLLSRLNPDDRLTVQKLLRLYRRADQETQRLATALKVRCPRQCGHCCATADVQTSVLEMLPLALKLWSTREGDRWLEKLNMPGSTNRCVFFYPQKKNPHRGRCQAYELRPLICRLFGFSFTKNKQGDTVYGGCKVINRADPRLKTRVKELLGRDPRFLTMTDLSIRLCGLGTARDHELIPINQAAKIALEKIGFILEKRKSACKM